MEAKKSNPIKVFLYISVWVIIWGTIGSLVDFPLYKNKIYSRRKYISISYFHNYSCYFYYICKVFL